MREQTSPLVHIRQGHAPEPASVDPRHAVVEREALVQVGVVRVQQLDDAPVGADRAADEQFGLLAERLEQGFVEVGIDLRIDLHFRNAPQIEPLRREVLDQRLDGARIGQHPANLFLQHVPVREPPLVGQPEEGLVREAAPEEEGEAGRDLPVTEAVGLPPDRAPSGSWYTRIRKSGSLRRNSSANWMPASKDPPLPRPST